MKLRAINSLQQDEVPDKSVTYRKKSPKAACELGADAAADNLEHFFPFAGVYVEGQLIYDAHSIFQGLHIAPDDDCGMQALLQKRLCHLQHLPSCTAELLIHLSMKGEEARFATWRLSKASAWGRWPGGVALLREVAAQEVRSIIGIKCMLQQKKSTKDDDRCCAISNLLILGPAQLYHRLHRHHGTLQGS